MPVCKIEVLCPIKIRNIVFPGSDVVANKISYRLLPGHVAVVQRLADALVKLVALQPIQ